MRSIFNYLEAMRLRGTTSVKLHYVAQKRKLFLTNAVTKGGYSRLWTAVLKFKSCKMNMLATGYRLIGIGGNMWKHIVPFPAYFFVHAGPWPPKISQQSLFKDGKSLYDKRLRVKVLLERRQAKQPSSNSRKPPCAPALELQRTSRLTIL